MIDESIYSNMKILQKFHYFQNMGINAFVAMIDEMPVHMHDGIELIFVLEGVIDVKISFNNYLLKTGEFLLINPYELHKIKRIKSNNAVLFLQLDKELFMGELFAFDPKYYNETCKEKTEEICGHMIEIYNTLIKEEHAVNKEKLEEKISELVIICDSNFQIQCYEPQSKTISPYSENEINSDRIKRAYEYMYQSYMNNIKLIDIANQEHINKSYASRIIKAGTGNNFQDIINIIRIDRTEVFLLGTNKSIQEIYEILGFSSYQYFIKQFKAQFKLTPSEYRSKIKPDVFPLKKMDYEVLNLTIQEVEEKIDAIKNMERIWLYLSKGIIENFKKLELLLLERSCEEFSLCNIKLRTEDETMIIESNDSLIRISKEMK